MPGMLATTFARRLRENREAAGLSQTELARRLTDRLGTAVPSTAVTKMENDTRSVKIDEAVAIAEVLRVPLLRMLGDDEDDRDAEIRHAQYDVDNAEVLLRAAQEELGRREAELERANARLEELLRREKLEELRAEQ